MSKLSLYADSLPPDAKTRYMDKIESIGGLDPFSSDFVGEKSDVVPPVSGCDLVSYLLLQTSFITSKQFKAHKSLEAYNQFVSGWVKDILQTHIVSVDIPPLLSFSSLSTAFDFAATPGTLHFLFAFCSRLVAARRLFEYLRSRSMSLLLGLFLHIPGRFSEGSQSGTNSLYSDCAGLPLMKGREHIRAL